MSTIAVIKTIINSWWTLQVVVVVDLLASSIRKVGESLILREAATQQTAQVFKAELKILFA